MGYSTPWGNDCFGFWCCLNLSSLQIKDVKSSSVSYYCEIVETRQKSKKTWPFHRWVADGYFPKTQARKGLAGWRHVYHMHGSGTLFWGFQLTWPIGSANYAKKTNKRHGSELSPDISCSCWKTHRKSYVQNRSLLSFLLLDLRPTPAVTADFAASLHLMAPPQGSVPTLSRTSRVF